MGVKLNILVHYEAVIRFIETDPSAKPDKVSRAISLDITAFNYVAEFYPEYEGITSDYHS
jgi:hypothetical protein